MQFEAIKYIWLLALAVLRVIVVVIMAKELVEVLMTMGYKNLKYFLSNLFTKRIFLFSFIIFILTFLVDIFI